VRKYIYNTRAKDVLPNINRTQAAEITPAATEWFRLLLVACSSRRYNVSCNRTDHSVAAGVLEVHSASLSLVTLIFDL